MIKLLVRATARGFGAFQNVAELRNGCGSEPFEPWHGDLLDRLSGQS